MGAIAQLFLVFITQCLQRCLQQIILSFTLLVVFGGILMGNTSAAIAGSAQEVYVSLGNAAGELKFEPSELTFTAGQTYKIVLENPSPTKHYFTAKDFADASWTKAVEFDKVEVKGAIHEVELKPGGAAEWILIPQKPGSYELHCSIAGHAEAGMVGNITINPA